MTYISNAIESASRLLNCLLLLGSVNESISARSYRQRNDSPFWATAYAAINKIFFWQDNHCRGAYNNRRKEMESWLEY